MFPLPSLPRPAARDPYFLATIAFNRRTSVDCLPRRMAVFESTIQHELLERGRWRTDGIAVFCFGKAFVTACSVLQYTCYSCLIKNLELLAKCRAYSVYGESFIQSCVVACSARLCIFSTRRKNSRPIGAFHAERVLSGRLNARGGGMGGMYRPHWWLGISQSGRSLH